MAVAVHAMVVSYVEEGGVRFTFEGHLWPKQVARWLWLCLQWR